MLTALNRVTRSLGAQVRIELARQPEMVFKRVAIDQELRQLLILNSPWGYGQAIIISGLRCLKSNRQRHLP